MRGSVSVCIGSWYGDKEITLEMPPSWSVDVLAPSTPPPLSDVDIAAAIARPVGQQPLRERARGKRRPLIVLDDLTRPTPTNLVVPHLLRELDAAGIHREDVGIILATGAHGQPPADAVARKAGAEAAGCRLIVHDAGASGIHLGHTTFGTPVVVDREVALSDLVIGVGGVYPQHSVGFGGGSKLILGVLARKSIVGLHYGHPSVAGAYDTNNDFRRNLDQMARMAGMQTIVNLHVDWARRPVRIAAGDPQLFYEAATRFSLEHYAAPPAGEDYDAIIANAYPMDVSLTFARSKGLAPFAYASKSASRALIAACPEGLGYHGLFPYLNGPRFERQIHRLRRWSLLKPSTIPKRAIQTLRTRARTLVAAAPAARPRQQYAGEVAPAVNRTIHLWAPMAPTGSLPVRIPDMRRAAGWRDVVRGIEAEQGEGGRLRVAVYACSPLQCIQTEPALVALGTHAS